MESPLKSLEQLAPFATAGELVRKKAHALASISPATTVLAAMQEMKQKHVAFLPVLEGEELVGVIAERDIARAVLLEERAAKDAAVREVMTTKVHTVVPEAKIPECIVIMHREGVRHLPVVAAGKVLGVLSVRDVMGSLIARHERLLRRFQEERLTLLFPDPGSY